MLFRSYAVYSVFAAFVLKITVPGWTSLVVLNIIFSGATLVAIGLVGEYVARIYEEAKGRPLYVIADSANLKYSEPQIAKAVILPARSIDAKRKRAGAQPQETETAYGHAAGKSNRI